MKAGGLLVLLVATGCGHPARRDPPAANHADPAVKTAADYYTEAVKLDSIACPDGTTLVGHGPPMDDYAYCVLPDEERHGPWMTWPSFGNHRKIAINDHGQIVHWTAWHPSNDALAVVSEMRADQDHGRTLWWHDNGRLASDCTYIHDHPDGPCQAWDRDGALISDVVIDDGTGTLVTWSYELRVEETWRDGVLDGPRSQWYPSGQVESITIYVAGEAGDREEWQPNGDKAVEEEPMCAHGPCDYPPE